LEYITAIWYILGGFGNLVAIWYIFSQLVHCVKKNLATLIQRSITKFRAQNDLESPQHVGDAQQGLRQGDQKFFFRKNQCIAFTVEKVSQTSGLLQEFSR
jgi:hypothetical protein